MNKTMKRLLSIAGGLLTAAILCSGLAIVYLAFPGTPAASRYMKFNGYVELPKHGILNVLDYLVLNGSTLFVTSESSGSVFSVHLNPDHLTFSTVSEMPGAGAAHGVALVPHAGVAFVTRSGENMVHVFDPDSLRQFQSIPVADDADAILYVPSAKLLYVANGDAHLATLIDPQKRMTVGTIPLPGKPEFVARDPTTGLLFQNLEDINSIAAINLESRSISGQWPLASCEGPSGMALDSEHRRLFAVCSKNATLVVFDMDTHRVIASLGIGRGPDSVTFDPILHRIYSAGTAGSLTVIQQDTPDTYRILDKIGTHYGAHTLTLDPVSHKVYVGYASLFVAPRIAVFSPVM